MSFCFQSERRQGAETATGTSMTNATRIVIVTARTEYPTSPVSLNPLRWAATAMAPKNAPQIPERNLARTDAKQSINANDGPTPHQITEESVELSAFRSTSALARAVASAGEAPFPRNAISKRSCPIAISARVLR